MKSDAARFLGKKVKGSEFYDPSLLVAVDRAENRKKYGITRIDGFDVWHAYEFSALTENGMPVTKVLKLKYSADSKFIVESKSLKLYLNSFNMTCLGKNTDECLKIAKSKIENDLSEKLNTKVEANFLNGARVEIFENFKDITTFVDEKTYKTDVFKESPELLEVEPADEKEYYLKFTSLRSNCKVTHQPDFGDAFIYYKSKKHIKEESLIKYLCSFRCEYHFHEECCEMIYKRLLDLGIENLFVCALYTRRGGIDICPVRYNCRIEDVDKLLDLTQFARNGIKQ